MQTFFQANRTLIKFEGPEAKKLLADVITGTVEENPDIASWWALLSPQGKIQAEGLIGWHGGAFYLDVSSKVKEKFLRRMNMFKLRAKADIFDLSETHSIGWSEQSASSNGAIVHKDGRSEHVKNSLGIRIIGERNSSANWLQDENAFAAKRINMGICELGEDFDTDTVFPHDIAMDLLGGVDFAKGCYVGQEVVSRMRHRGDARKRPVVICFDDGWSNISPGAEIISDEKKVGTVGRIVKGKAVGIARLDRIVGAAKISISDQSVTLAVPPWASYDFALDSQ